MSSISSIPSLISSRKSFSDQSCILVNDTSPALLNSLKLIDLILTNQQKALKHLVLQYRHSEFTQSNLKNSLILLNNSIIQGGKIVVSGMGKSFKIASKFVATLNSLSIHSAALHPSDALHGDLGILREDHGDVIILISASGDSPELLNMLHYIPDSINIILLTCNKVSKLSKHPRVSSLLFAELPNELNEKSIYGLSAPTISTTLCLSLLDSVSIALAELQIKDLSIRQRRFGERHPGGAIGLNYQTQTQTQTSKPSTYSQSQPNLMQSTSMSVSSTRSNLFSPALTQTTTSTTDPEAALGAIESDLLIENLKKVQLSEDNKRKELEEEEIEIELNSDTDSDCGLPMDMELYEADDDEDALQIKDIRLLNDLKNSVSTIESPHFPQNELEFLQMISMYDYMILGKKNNTKTVDPKLSNTNTKSRVLVSQDARDMYKTMKLQNEKWTEMSWKLENLMIKIDL